MFFTQILSFLKKKKKSSRYSHKDQGMINNDQCSICFGNNSACVWHATEERVLHSDYLGY